MPTGRGPRRRAGASDGPPGGGERDPTAPSGGKRARAADWPQWRGPDRTGVSRETGLLKRGRRAARRCSGRQRAGHRQLDAVGAPAAASSAWATAATRRCVWALDEATGKPALEHPRRPANRQIGPQAHDGPRCTPTVDGDRVYALGVSGDLVCLQVSDGKLLWQKNLVSDFGGAVPQLGL